MIEITTLVHCVREGESDTAKRERQSASEDLALALNDGWEIIDISFTSPSLEDYPTRFVTLKRENKIRAKEAASFPVQLLVDEFNLVDERSEYSLHHFFGRVGAMIMNFEKGRSS